MLVLLDAGLFGPPHLHADLTRLLHFALTGRHEVLIDLPGAENVRDWLEKYDVVGEYRVALELSQQVASSPGRPCSVLVREGSDCSWSTNPSVLSPRSACALLERPYSVFLENARRDGSFLRALGRPDQAREWSRLTSEERLWILPDNAGGLPEMLAILESRVMKVMASRMRSFFLFDSDSWAPGRPSAKSKALEKKCKQNYLDHHQLKRRAPENYLHTDVLQSWLRQRSRTSSIMRAQIDAFDRLDAEQRHYFNMKKGFGGDEKDTGRPKRDREAAELLYRDLPKDQRELLADGFGPQIADCFAEPAMPFQPDPEIVEVLDQIFAAR